MREVLSEAASPCQQCTYQGHLVLLRLLWEELFKKRWSATSPQYKALVLKSDSHKLLSYCNIYHRFIFLHYVTLYNNNNETRYMHHWSVILYIVWKCMSMLISYLKYIWNIVLWHCNCYTFLDNVRCFSANSTICSSTFKPFLLRTLFTYFLAIFSESAFSPKCIYSSSVVGTQNGSTSITYNRDMGRLD